MAGTCPECEGTDLWDDNQWEGCNNPNCGYISDGAVLVPVMTPDEALAKTDHITLEVQAAMEKGFSDILDIEEVRPDELLGPVLLSYFMHMQVMIEWFFHDSIKELNQDDTWESVRADFKKEHPEAWDFDAEEETTH